MSEEAGRLLAAIAQLEERLSRKVDDGFKKMEQLTEDKLEEMKSEMSGMKKGMKGMKKEMSETREEMKKEMGEQLAGMEDRIMEKLNTVRNGNDSGENENPLTGDANEDRSVKSKSAASLHGWSSESEYDSDYDEVEVETRTAIEPGIPKSKYGRIYWKAGDEIIRKMQAERMSKDEEIPSFWNYDPRCLAKEFVGLDQKTFLVDPSTFNICFFNKVILRKISKMLIPMDFVNLSYTCRFLHWRLFTFCTCYVPYIMDMAITNVKGEFYYRHGDEVAASRYGVDPLEKIYSVRLDTPLAKEKDRRAVVARVPSWKAFLF